MIPALPSHYDNLKAVFAEAKTHIGADSPLAASIGNITKYMDALATIINRINETLNSPPPLCTNSELCQTYIHTLLTVVEYATIDLFVKPEARQEKSGPYVDMLVEMKDVVPNENAANNLAIAESILHRACNGLLLDALSDDPEKVKGAADALASIHSYFSTVGQESQLTNDGIDGIYVAKRILLFVVLSVALVANLFYGQGTLALVLSSANMGLAALTEVIAYLVKGKSYASKMTTILYGIISAVSGMACVKTAIGSETQPAFDAIWDTVANGAVACAYGSFTVSKGCNWKSAATRFLTYIASPKNGNN